MKINSIYGGMHTAANNVPDGENVKLLLRHSIRHEKPETDSLRYNGIPLCARAVWRTMLV